MKHSFRYSILCLALGLISSMNAWAVAPLPGLNRKEPLRQTIPHGSVAQQHAQRAAAAPRQAATLATRGLLIVVEFADVPLAAGNTVHSFDSLANADHYTYNGATGSCKQYYQDQSNGKYTPQFDVVGPVVLPQTQAYYGTDKAYEGDDRYVVDFVIDACKGAQQLGVDFSQYDANNDGEVDLVYILYAGHGQADGGAAATIWPHAWDLESALYFGNTNQSEYYVHCDASGYIIAKNMPVLNGKTIVRYACSNELIYRSNIRTGIGTICHEFGHVLGLVDLYITESNVPGDSKAIPGSWALMSHGNYLNNGNTPPNLSVWEKYFLGWVEPEMLSNSTSVMLPADGKTYYALNRNHAIPAEGALTTDTVYYFENRQMMGWDTYLPGHGMLAWRIAYDADDWYYNRPNNYTTRFALIAANGASPYTADLLGGARQDVPFPGDWYVTEFQPYQHAYLTDIEENDGVITFQFTNTATDIESPEVDNILTNQQWYNLLGQPIDIRSYRGVVVNRQGKIVNN